MSINCYWGSSKEHVNYESLSVPVTIVITKLVDYMSISWFSYDAYWRDGHGSSW